MPIVKQTLHPEGDTGTDIYPKTSTDQITDLPLSSQKQLYAHYHEFYSSNGQNGNISGQIFFINSDNTNISGNKTITEFNNYIKSQISYCCVIIAKVEVTTAFNSTTSSPINIPVGNYMVVRNGITPSPKEDFAINIVNLTSNLNEDIYLEDLLGEGTLMFFGPVVSLGSNAG